MSTQRLFNIFITAFAMAGCGNAHVKSNDDLEVESYQLRSVQSCEDLESQLKATALEEMEGQLNQLRQGGNFRAVAVSSDVSLPSAAGEASNASDAASSKPPEHSETNTQEANVDEADLVKTDGNFLYVVGGGTLTLLKSFPAAELREVSRLQLNGNAEELFVEGDRAVIFSRVGGSDVPSELRTLPSSSSKPAICEVDPSGNGGCGSYASVTRISLLDIADRNAPRLLRDLYTEANYVTSRKLQGVVRIVLNGYVDGPDLDTSPDSLDFLYEPVDSWTFAEKRALEREIALLKSQNRQRIAASTLADWLPRALVVDHQHGTRQLDSIAPCEQFYRSQQPDGRGVLDIVTLDLSHDDAAFGHAAILGFGSQVYASEQALYVAAHPFWSSWGWWGWNSEAGEVPTRLHKFDIASNRDVALYRGSGAVAGHVLNQFSMDEENGFLRIATTTDGDRWTGDRARPAFSENHLFVMREEAGRLQVTGQVTGLAPGERVYSARFVGNTGYLVTFRQVDPLFTFDLSDASQPRLLGELKIPGFSTYMHPLDEGHLLTIGQAADELGRVQGLQLSIFDVRDLTQPKLAHQFIMEGRWSQSEALYNHKAFGYFAPHQLLAIPVTLWDPIVPGSGYDEFVGLRAFRIDATQGIKHLADISHNDLYQVPAAELTQSYPGWNQVRRSLTIADHLYSVSGRGIVATPLAALDGPATATAALPDR